MNDAGALSKNSRLQGLRVLVVEDECIVSFLMEDMLAELGCKVIGNAVGVQEALALLSEHKPDAVVLDVNLRGEMAFPVAERLQSELIPFLFSTGYGTAGIPPQWRRHPVLQKPFRMAELEKALEEAVATRPE